MNPLDEPMHDMDSIPVSPWPTILKYGGIGSLILILFGVFGFLISERTNSYVSTTIISFAASGFSILVYILIMIFSIKEYRDKFSNGYISLGKGMLVSYGSAFMMGSVGILFNLLYFLVIDPTYMQRQLEKSYTDMGIDPSTMSHATNMYTPIMIAGTQVTSFALGCVFGAILSLIVSAVMKKDRPYNSR